MSRRHRGYDKDVTKDDRRAEHRRDRRAARQQIDVVEPDAAVLPGEGPAHLHAHRPTVREKSRPRHWKLPFWKRRQATRAQRVQAERRLADEE
ncbi:MAG: hypothetical protein ACRDYV_02505 [Acidimicrobiia bacterium]